MTEETPLNSPSGEIPFSLMRRKLSCKEKEKTHSRWGNSTHEGPEAGKRRMSLWTGKEASKLEKNE